MKQGDPLVDIHLSTYQMAAYDQAEGQLARDNAPLVLENARIYLSRYQEAFSKNAHSRNNSSSTRRSPPYIRMKAR